jgi:hypothetical protein
MKRILLFLLFLPLTLMAAKKPQQAVVNLISYKADGTILASGYGFLLSAEGKTVVPYTLLEGAERAEVIDAKGKRYPVSRIVGASSTYDLAVVTLEAKKPKFDFFTVATDSVAVGEVLNLYQYSTSKKAKPVMTCLKQSTPKVPSKSLPAGVSPLSDSVCSRSPATVSAWKAAKLWKTSSTTALCLPTSAG